MFVLGRLSTGPLEFAALNGRFCPAAAAEGDPTLLLWGRGVWEASACPKAPFENKINERLQAKNKGEYEEQSKRTFTWNTAHHRSIILSIGKMGPLCARGLFVRLRLRARQRPLAKDAASPRSLPAVQAACRRPRSGPLSAPGFYPPGAAPRGDGRPQGRWHPAFGRRSPRGFFRSPRQERWKDRRTRAAPAHRTNIRAAATRCTWPPDRRIPRRPYRGFQSVRHAGQIPRKRRRLQRGGNVAFAGQTQQDVVSHAVAENSRHLRSIGHARRHKERAPVIHRDTVPPHSTLSGRQKTQQGYAEASSCPTRSDRSRLQTRRVPR